MSLIREDVRNAPCPPPKTTTTRRSRRGNDRKRPERAMAATEMEEKPRKPCPWMYRCLGVITANHQRGRQADAAVGDMKGRGWRGAMAATEMEEKPRKPCPWMYRCLGVITASHQTGRQGEADVGDMKGRGRRRAMAATEIEVEEKQREQTRRMHRWPLQVQTRGVGASIVILVVDIHRCGIDQQEHAGPTMTKKDVMW